jgi:hypothetical protein
MTGKRLTMLEMPEEEAVSPALSGRSSNKSIPLPPIPEARRREAMVQLSVKAPEPLVNRLDRLTRETGAMKQQVLAAALDAYLTGHGY